MRHRQNTHGAFRDCDLNHKMAAAATLWFKLGAAILWFTVTPMGVHSTTQESGLKPLYNVYRCVHNKKVSMELVKVGIREFRERLAAYLLESDTPVAITRHGDTVGYFIPARRKRVATERAALKKAAAQLDAMLAAKGITEDELAAEFKRERASKHR